MTDTPKLEWKGVRKRFDGPVLDGLDLSVAAGRSLVIIGGSGQGKSVTIKVAMGLVRPDAGKVLVDGEDLIGPSLKWGAAHPGAGCSNGSESCSRARRCSTA